MLQRISCCQCVVGADMPASVVFAVRVDAQVRWLMHYVRGMVTHYMAAVQHIMGNREAQADCYHAQVQRQLLSPFDAVNNATHAAPAAATGQPGITTSGLT
jgi:hypothetical protein